MVATFVGSAFALVRLVVVQGRAASDRLCGVIEAALARQSELLERMGADLREQNGLLARIAGRERLR